MTTFFKIENATFTSNDNYTYFYKTIDGKKTRIGKAEYEENLAKFEAGLDNAAEDPEVTLEQFIEKIDESETTEETKKIAKKVRKSKDIAYEGHGVTLTAKQVDFIKHLPDTNFWENGLDSTPWTDVLADEIGGQFAGKPMTVGAMISTICEKGLASRSKQKVNGKKCTFMELTDLGKAVAKDLGLR